MEEFSDGGSTPPASTNRKTCDCFVITGLLSFYPHFSQKSSFYSYSPMGLTPHFTPYRFEALFISRSILSWDSFRMVSDTAAYTSIVNALE